MASERDARRRAYVDKTAAEVDSLAARGVALAGNAFAAVLFLKGQPGPAEREGGEPLSGADGRALRASLDRLGYAPEDWAAALTCDFDENPLDPALVRELVSALDPSTLVCCDEAAADAVREGWAEDLAVLPRFEEAMLQAGEVAQVAGMRVLNLGGFEAALDDAHAKQVMWARLKRIPPLGEPY